MLAATLCKSAKMTLLEAKQSEMPHSAHTPAMELVKVDGYVEG
jgi:hypothetical protein